MVINFCATKLIINLQTAKLTISSLLVFNII
nr:MAG TPA_asm: hypothetical protein [Caudoviricetes sp.]